MIYEVRIGDQTLTIPVEGEDHVLITVAKADTPDDLLVGIDLWPNVLPPGLGYFTGESGEKEWNGLL